MPRADSTVPTGSRPTCSVGPAGRHDGEHGGEGDHGDRGGREEDRLPREHAEHPARRQHPERASGPGEPGPDAHRPGPLLGGNTLVMVDRVPGMISAPPRPVSARKAMSCVPESANADSERAGPEQRDADEQRTPPAVAVAERTGEQQERRQGEGVGVGDPREAALAEAQVLADAGEADRQHRHAGDHQHEGQAHRGEHERALARARSAAGRGVFRGVRVPSWSPWGSFPAGARAVRGTALAWSAGRRCCGRTRGCRPGATTMAALETKINVTEKECS